MLRVNPDPCHGAEPPLKTLSTACGEAVGPDDGHDGDQLRSRMRPAPSRVRCAWDRDHLAVLAAGHDKCHPELATSASVAARPRPGESGYDNRDKAVLVTGA